jgi:hypothetical protein
MVGFFMFGMVAQVLLRFRHPDRIPFAQRFKRFPDATISFSLMGVGKKRVMLRLLCAHSAPDNLGRCYGL